MTTYTAIADTEIDAESPLTEELMTRVRDNPIALAEGATGAPRIWGSAIARPQDMPTLTVTAADTVSVYFNCDYTAGTTSTTNNDNPHTVVAATWVLRSVTGTVRVSATQTTDDSGNNVSASAWKNGVQQGATQTTSSTSGLAVTFDVSAVPGDTIQLRHAVVFGTSPVSQLTNVDLKASDGYVQRVPYVANSGFSTE